MAEPTVEAHQAERGLIAQLGEWGFVLPPGGGLSESWSASRARVRHVPGLAADPELQYFHVRLTDQRCADREVFVISGLRVLSDETVASTAALLLPHFVDGGLVFDRRIRDGLTTVACLDATCPELAAAAVATVMALAGWDESDPIVVELGEHKLDVSMHWSDKRWTARVRPHAIRSV